MSGKGQIVSASGLAAVFGVHRNTVNNWVKKGCPYIQKADRRRGQEWQFSTAEVAQWRTEQAIIDAVGDTATVDKEELIKRKLAAETTIAEIEAAKRKGQVAELDEIEKQWSDTIIELRARFRQLPARVAAQLVGVTSKAEIKEILLDEIDETLTVLADVAIDDDDEAADDGGV